MLFYNIICNICTTLPLLILIELILPQTKDSDDDKACNRKREWRWRVVRRRRWTLLRFRVLAEQSRVALVLRLVVPWFILKRIKPLWLYAAGVRWTVSPRPRSPRFRFRACNPSAEAKCLPRPQAPCTVIQIPSQFFRVFKSSRSISAGLTSELLWLYNSNRIEFKHGFTDITNRKFVYL